MESCGDLRSGLTSLVGLGQLIAVHAGPDDDVLTETGARLDEQAALAELEHVRKEIERYQAIRLGVNEEFERFVKSFKSPERPVAISFTPVTPPVQVVEPPPVQVIAPPPPVVAPAPAVAEPAPEKLTPLPAAIRLEDVAPDTFLEEEESPFSDESPFPPFPAGDPFAEHPSEEALPAFAPEDAFDALPPPLEDIPAAATHMPPPQPAPSSARTWFALGSAIVIIAAGGYVWTLRDTAADTPAPVANSAPQTPVSPAEPGAAPAQAPAAAEPAAPPASAESVLTTTKAAWVRIVADGERLVERELPADARIVIPARETIVVRTGNAGAVRIAIAGVDQGALGNEGEVVTRTFALNK